MKGNEQNDYTQGEFIGLLTEVFQRQLKEKFGTQVDNVDFETLGELSFLVLQSQNPHWQEYVARELVPFCEGSSLLLSLSMQGKTDEDFINALIETAAEHKTPIKFWEENEKKHVQVGSGKPQGCIPIRRDNG